MDTDTYDRFMTGLWQSLSLPVRGGWPPERSEGSDDAKIAELRLHTFAEPVNRGFGAAAAVRDFERIERHFDHAKHAQDHRRVDMAHMGDAERLALKLADPDAEHHAAFFLGVAMQLGGIVIA